MPFYEKGDVRIRYEEAGSGFWRWQRGATTRCKGVGHARQVVI